MSFIVGEDKAALGWQALVIWSLFLLCIILDTISIFSAKQKAEKLELLFREKVNQGQTMPETEVNKMIDHTNRSINRFNMIVFILLLITIVWTFIYSYLLLIKVS
jgi:acid phosphatase family membrane protein YuiD